MITQDNIVAVLDDPAWRQEVVEAAGRALNSLDAGESVTAVKSALNVAFIDKRMLESSVT